MSFHKDWVIKNTQVNESLVSCCKNSRVLAVLLQNRGIDTPEKIQKFLNPLNEHLLAPEVFRDMQKSVERVKNAVENNEHITVYGDFDADGVTSTSLLYLTLKEIGADVDYYLPDRAMESHGLNTKALVHIISKRKSKLIITVDCGISNVEEVHFAKNFKTDIIITDHHEAPEILPEAYTVLNPKAPDNIDPSLNIDDIQSLNYLAGVGVALKFAYGLLIAFNKTEFANNLIPLAAVGTVGDVVELLGENRTIVSAGLELIRNGAHKGIQKILKSAGIEDVKTITSETVAFTIVPRLNAAGRLESPQTALNVLIGTDDEMLDENVKTLNNLNELRQNLCDETFNTADEMYKKDSARNKKGIILYNSDWHIGIIGIVASKLVEKYNTPVFLMTSDSNTPEIIRCSSRSIQGLNIHGVLSELKELFEGFGGHKMAAGFSFNSTKISFENFKAKLLDKIDEHSKNIDFKKVTVYADMELEPDDITQETVKLIDTLQPFGSANPSPLFILKEAVIQDFRMMGQNANHLKLYVSKNNCRRLDCIKWNTPEFNLPANTKIDLLFSMRLNTFNDVTNVQLMLEDMHSELLNKEEKASEISFLDHRRKKDILERVIDFALSSQKTTAIYIENPSLIKNLKLPQTVNDKLFTLDNIPNDIQQIMFFDVPPTKEDFYNILKTTNAHLVHLMNFGTEELSCDTFISKLSGMLKYALSNLNGIISTRRAAKALSASNETVECALTLLEDSEMIDLNKVDEDSYQISYVHPVEISKVKGNDIFPDLESHLHDINAFRSFYLNSPIEEIKEMVIC